FALYVGPFAKPSRSTGRFCKRSYEQLPLVVAVDKGSGVLPIPNLCEDSQPPAPFSRPVEDIVKIGRGPVAFHVTGQESQDAVVAVDPTPLAQHAAFRLVVLDLGLVHVQRAVEGIDPAAQGRGALRLVVVDLAVGQRQTTVFTGDPAALGQ